MLTPKCPKSPEISHVGVKVLTGSIVGSCDVEVHVVGNSSGIALKVSDLGHSFPLILHSLVNVLVEIYP